MMLNELLSHFSIEEDIPDYLLNESFNDIFLKGDITINDDGYEIVVNTSKNVVHTMIIKPNEEFPITIMSYLPNGSLNGIKFGCYKDNVKYINEL